MPTEQQIDDLAEVLLENLGSHVGIGYCRKTAEQHLVEAEKLKAPEGLSDFLAWLNSDDDDEDDEAPADDALRARIEARMDREILGLIDQQAGKVGTITTLTQASYDQGKVVEAGVMKRAILEVMYPERYASPF